MATFNRQRLIFGLYLIVLIVIAELIIGHYALPAWPAFMAMIFFFVEHMDSKKAGHIVLGGTFGIACLVLAKLLIAKLAPWTGVEIAKLLFVVAVVYAIVAFGELLPRLFNNYAFMYLTVAGVAAQQPNANVPLWMAMSAIGGSLLIAGVLVIGRLMTSAASSRERSGGARQVTSTATSR